MKKLNKLFAILVAMAMVLSLGVVSAFAADPAAEDAVLTKRVETPKGTEFIGGTFTFTFEQKTTDDTYAVETDDAEIGTRSITIVADDKMKDGAENNIYVDIAHLFDTPASVKGNTNQKPFSHAGVYKYEVTETAGYPADGNGVDYENSQAVYTVYVVVSNNEAKNDLIVTNVIAVKTADDKGGEVTSDPKKDQVLPGEGSDEDENGNKIGSAWAYTNTYTKTQSTNPNGEEDEEEPKNPSDDNDAKTLYVQKILVDEKDIIDPTTEFEFTVTIFIPTLASEATYGAYVVDTAAQDPTAAVTGTNKTASFARGTTTTQTVKLKANERLVFAKLPQGATFTVKETNPGNKFTVGTVSNATVTEDGLGITTETVKGDGNYVRTTNTVNSQTTEPEGILISNLPYIALALVAIGGLVAYVVVRRRNSDEA